VDDFAAGLTSDGIVEAASGEPVAVGSLRIWHRGYVCGGATPAVLAAAYARWGGDLAAHVDGQYAAAIHDVARGKLTLVHDDFGVVPLFYAAAGGAVTFGSDLGDVVARTGIGELDDDYLSHFLVHGLVPPGLTPYAHVRRLLPAEHATWSAGMLRTRQRKLAERVEPFRGDDRELGERFRVVVAEAVATAIPPDAQAWCELSGGLDSSTIVAFAAGRLGRSVEAMSWVHPRAPLADETRWMRVVTDAYPVPWHTFDGDSDPPYSDLPEGFLAEPTPQAVMRTGTQQRLGEHLRKRGVDLVITGNGGDAVLFGDHPPPTHLADLVRRLRLLRLWRECRRWADTSPERRAPTYYLLRYGVRLARDPAQGYGPPPGTASAPWLSERVADAAQAVPWPPHPAIPRGAGVGDGLYLDSVLTSADMLAGGARGRATGVPERHPLLHRPLVELMRSVPWERKLAPDRDRVVQRAALTDVLPAATLARDDKSRPTQVFTESFSTAREWHARLTERPLMAERGLVDADRWREAVAKARLGGASSRHFLAAMAVEIWLQQLRHAPSPSPERSVSVP
jgi:asparagine synthase (glutamine-hydrolysing)